MATHSSILAWKIPRTEEPSRLYSPWGHKESDMTERLTHALTTNAEEVEDEQFYEDLQDLLELTPQKGVPFIIGHWNAEVRSQETPGVTGKFVFGVQ